MKKCSVCQLEKEEREFYKKRNSLESFCKKCKREKAKVNFDKNREANLENDRIRAKKRREDDPEYFKNWRRAYKERNKEKIKKQLSEYYELNKEHLIKKAKEWRAKNKEKVKKSIKKHKKKYPIKQISRQFLSVALKQKIIERPNNCEKCMKECKPDAHHEDYLKPLDVKWLCKVCHGYTRRL